jgi:serine protease inhibitor
MVKNRDSLLLGNFQVDFDVGELEELSQSLVHRQVMVYFPRFKLETGYQMRDMLSGMGMPSVFIPGKPIFLGWTAPGTCWYLRYSIKPT